MTLYNMAGCNTSRTNAGNVHVRAGQFRGYRPGVKVQNTVTVNENIIFNTKNRCCNHSANYGYGAYYQTPCMPQDTGGGIWNALMGFFTMLSTLGKSKAPEPDTGDDGRGGPGNEPAAASPPPAAASPKPAAEAPADPKAATEEPKKDVYDAAITEKQVKEEAATHTVKHGECWYDVLKGKYPNIPSSDQKAAMRELKKANGITDFNSADMPRKMYLPKEIKVGNNTYKLNDNGTVTGTVKQFTTGGMYDAKIPENTRTEYTLSRYKNYEEHDTQKYTNKEDATAAKAAWLKQNDDDST